jgi:hypothetical protein
MKIGRKYNTLIFKQYLSCIDNHKKYTDFNTLGLYRSILENSKLTLEEKIAVRDHAHQFFRKSFDFLQLKDPVTFVEVTYLGQERTKEEERRIYDNVRIQQQKILADKRIKHRNFGEYSKHNCGYETCPLNGIMIRQGSRMAEMEMQFGGDHNHYAQREKSERRKSERKSAVQIIRKALESEE